MQDLGIRCNGRPRLAVIQVRHLHVVCRDGPCHGPRSCTSLEKCPRNLHGAMRCCRATRKVRSSRRTTACFCTLWGSVAGLQGVGWCQNLALPAATLFQAEILEAIHPSTLKNPVAREQHWRKCSLSNLNREAVSQTHVTDNSQLYPAMSSGTYHLSLQDRVIMQRPFP